MHVVVAGTGTVGEQVALALVDAGNTVAVVDGHAVCTPTGSFQ